MDLQSRGGLLEHPKSPNASVPSASRPRVAAFRTQIELWAFNMCYDLIRTRIVKMPWSQNVSWPSPYFCLLARLTFNSVTTAYPDSRCDEHWLVDASQTILTT